MAGMGRPGYRCRGLFPITAPANTSDHVTDHTVKCHTNIVFTLRSPYRLASLNKFREISKAFETFNILFNVGFPNHHHNHDVNGCNGLKTLKKSNYLITKSVYE